MDGYPGDIRTCLVGNARSSAGDDQQCMRRPAQQAVNDDFGAKRSPAGSGPRLQRFHIHYVWLTEFFRASRYFFDIRQFVCFAGSPIRAPSRCRAFAAVAESCTSSVVRGLRQGFLPWRIELKRYQNGFRCRVRRRRWRFAGGGCIRVASASTTSHRRQAVARCGARRPCARSRQSHVRRWRCLSLPLSLSIGRDKPLLRGRSQAALSRSRIRAFRQPVNP